MKNNQLLKNGERLVRVIDVQKETAFIVDCKKNSMPKWVSLDLLSDYTPYAEEVEALPCINDLDLTLRKAAYERFTVISGVLPFLTNKRRRSIAIEQVATDKKICRQTVCTYLWLYLVHQNVSALAPKEKDTDKELTDDEKNFRWALNKFYYTKNENTLNTTYTLMLKEKYCDSSGVLYRQYPTFHQFRYYHIKNKKMQNYYISRSGMKSYQRDYRPLLGDGIQELAHAVGIGMLDATLCDIYLVNEAGGLVGRPILTACVDAYSGLCCGYSLSWEGGVYSLRNLLVNIISDKKELCKKRGISIASTDWNCSMLPGTFITDMGKEYVSSTFEQVAELGITVVNLPPYRPELKGAVEKFFDVIQCLYKPHLKGKGVIEPDYQERGAHDYRKDAQLTMSDFEKIILHCILYYNSQRVVDSFPYTSEMLADGMKPYANSIWNYGLSQMGANLIPVDYNTLILTLLPRTTGKFTRKGLIVNKIRYKNDSFTESYLTGGSVNVAYNPDDVAEVWLIDKGKYILFTLIESRFSGKDAQEAQTILDSHKSAVDAAKTANLQAKIDLAKHIAVIAASAVNQGGTEIKDTKNNKRREKRKTHIDYVKEGWIND